MPDMKICVNKGVGYGIVKHLLLQTKVPMVIYMTSRDESRGKAALQAIKSESGINEALKKSEVKWLRLDILDEKSINDVHDQIIKEHGKKSLDLLINNAGIAVKGNTFNAKVVDTTLACNYFATLKMCETFIDDIKPGGRIVNVSSMASKLHKLSPELRGRFSDPALTIAQTTALMQEFKDSVRGSSASKGWPNQAYSVSKMGVTAISKVFAREHKDILINAICPGWVRTDMAGDRAPLSIDEGAQTPVHVAIGQIGSVSGEFWEKKSVSVW